MAVITVQDWIGGVVAIGLSLVAWLLLITKGYRRMSIESKVAELKAKTGFDDLDEAVEEHEGWHYGERVRVVDDVDEETGPWAGDEGYVVINKLGAARYGNERVAIHFLADGTDAPEEVSTFYLEGA